MRNWLERSFEWGIWNTRFVVVVAVVASLVAAIAVFWVTTLDVYYAAAHLLEYADPALSEEMRKTLRDSTVTHVVEVVDGYLLASVMLIFALGLYELFIGDIDLANSSRTSSKILIIASLDDLKNKLAKVILMILIVRMFEYAVKMRLDGMLDLVYFSLSIALVGLALFLTHVSESHGNGKAEARAEKQPSGEH